MTTFFSSAAQPTLQSGWPRPWVDHKPTASTPSPLLPVPWINTKPVEQFRDWLTFDEQALVKIVDSRYQLCGICGEQLGTTKIFGSLGSLVPTTTGTGMHPRCALLAATTCPYFARMIGNQFYRYDGPGHGLDLGQAADDGSDDPDISSVPLVAGVVPLSLDELRKLVKQTAATD